MARIEDPMFCGQSTNWHHPVTEWTQACDRRLARLISYGHFTSDYRQYCHVGNAAQHCRSGLFSRFRLCRGILKTQNQQQARVLCILGNRTFVPISWMCKKQTSVSHSSTESEIISLDAGLRMDGLPAIDLWDLVIEVLGTIHNIPKQTQACTRNRSRDQSTPKIKQVLDQNVDLRTKIKFLRTHISLRKNHSCTFSKTTKL